MHFHDLRPGRVWVKSATESSALVPGAAPGESVNLLTKPVLPGAGSKASLRKASQKPGE